MLFVNIENVSQPYVDTREATSMERVKNECYDYLRHYEGQVLGLLNLTN